MIFDLNKKKDGASGRRPFLTGRNLLSVHAALSLFMILLMSGCLERIDLGAPEELQSAIVIQGQLAKGAPSSVEVTVSSLFTFTSASRRLIAVKEVLLIDESGQEVAVPPSGVGVYSLDIPENHPFFKVEIGASYHIRVTTHDGRVFESSTDRLTAVPGLRSLSAEIFDKEVINREGQFATEKYVRFFIETPLRTAEDGKKSLLKWDAFRTYKLTDLKDPAQTCFLTELSDVTKLRLLNGKLLESDEVKGITVHEEKIGSNFSEGYYLTVVQRSLSDEAFGYWEEVGELIDFSNSIFEPPAGKVKSNFRNIDDPDDEVFGFFYTAETDTARIYISPEFVGNPRPYCPPPMLLCPANICCDCLAASESTLTKPYFWVE